MHAEKGPEDGNSTTGPPSKSRVAGSNTKSIKETRNGWSECSAQARCRGGNAVDSSKGHEARCRVCEQNRIAGVRHGRESALPDNHDVDADNSQVLRQQGQVRCRQIEHKVRNRQESEQPEGTKASGNPWEDEDSRDHGVNTLNRENDTNGLGLHRKAAGELEWEVSIRVLARRGAKEDGEQLIKGHGVASKRVSMLMRVSK